MHGTNQGNVIWLRPREGVTAIGVEDEDIRRALLRMADELSGFPDEGIACHLKEVARRAADLLAMCPPGSERATEVRLLVAEQLRRVEAALVRLRTAMAGNRTGTS